MKLLLVLAVGTMAAVPLLAQSPAQALTACASATGLALTDSCTIDDRGTIYEISLVTGTFVDVYPGAVNFVPHPNMFWFVNPGGVDAASIVGPAFGTPNFWESRGPYFSASSQRHAVRFYNLAFPNSPQFPGIASGAINPDTTIATWATSRVYVASTASTTGGGNLASAPGPLPVLGVAAAFGFSRKLRKRIKRGTNSVAGTLGA